MSSPRVEACIQEVLARHPGNTPAALARYFEDVHQELAPLARQLENELATKLTHAQQAYEALAKQLDEAKARAAAADRRTRWLLEHASDVIEIVRRWDPAQGSLMAYLESRVGKELGKSDEEEKG